MNTAFLTVLAAALPVFIILALGFGLRRIGVLTAEADGSLMKLVIRVFYPCFCLNYLIGNAALDDPRNLIWPPLVGFFTVTGGFILAYAYARLAGFRVGKGLRTFAFGSGIYNYGFIPIPIILVLFNDRGTLGVLLVHNLGAEIAIWTVGIMLLAGKFRVRALGNLFNPPIAAMAVALFVNTAGLDASMPGWLTQTIAMLAACLVPVGILLAGALIADLFQDQKLFSGLKVVTGSVFIRLGLLPLGFLLLAAFLPGISTELRQVIVVEAAMPAGIMPIVLARHYGGDAGVAVRIVLATTVVSVVTMPLWIHLGVRFVL